MYLSSKLQTRQSLTKMCLKRTDHDEHESFRVAAEGELEEVCQLSHHVSSAPPALKDVDHETGGTRLTLLFR